MGERRGEGAKRGEKDMKNQRGRDDYETRVGGETASPRGGGRERTKKKKRKIRRIWAHRCVYYSPSYSSDIHGHAKLAGRLRLTSIWPALLSEYLIVSKCIFYCRRRSM